MQQTVVVLTGGYIRDVAQQLCGSWGQAGSCCCAQQLAPLHCSVSTVLFCGCVHAASAMYHFLELMEDILVCCSLSQVLPRD